MTLLLKRLLYILVIFETAYVLIVNIALNIPVTQSLINQIKPDKFAIRWASAWSLYPLKVHVRELSVNGQIPSQQWQLDLAEGSASLAILPLLGKRANISNVKGRDINFSQRPRPKVGRDYSAIREFFPPIEGRQLETVAPPPVQRKTGGGWKIQLSNIQAEGKHQLWLYQAQVDLEGSLAGNLAVETRGGPLSMDNINFDLAAITTIINGDNEVFRDGSLKGSGSIEPFIVRENKGIKALQFIDLDTTIRTETRSLKFLNFYLKAFKGMKINGKGSLDGRLALSRGKLLPGTDLAIDAKQLDLSVLEYRVEGSGDIRIDVPEQTDESRLAIKFRELSTYVEQQQTPMFDGDNLVITAIATNAIIPAGDERFKAKVLSMQIESVNVPDLQTYQQFIPEKWPLKLLGGSGMLEGNMSVTPDRLAADFLLTSDQADAAIKDYQFTSNLEVRVKLDSPELRKGIFNASGTYIKIDNATVSEGDDQSKPWFAELRIKRGEVDIKLDDLSAENLSEKTLLATLRDQKARDLLGNANNTLELAGKISDLRWLNLLINTPYNFAISGGGEIESTLLIQSGQLDKGSRIALAPQRIKVEILDYQADGDGRVEFEVIEGGESPDLALDVELEQGTFKRKGDSQAFVEKVHIILNALARDVSLDPKAQAEDRNADVDLNLQIISARVLDMAIYNQYLPPQSPLQFVSGQADLNADIKLQPDDAKGSVTLTTQNLVSRVDEQEVSGELVASIKLNGGQPRDMMFDIQGSSIRLDQVKVSGETRNFSDEDWNAELRLTRGETVWRKPVQLDMEAELTMSNSIPLISMMANNKGKENWLSKALTIDDVNGRIEMQMADRQIVIPYAYVSSDKIDVGAKAVISENFRDGILFARYGKLHGIMKIRNGKRNIDILKARIKFDEYSPEKVVEARIEVQKNPPPEAPASEPNY